METSQLLSPLSQSLKLRLTAQQANCSTAVPREHTQTVLNFAGQRVEWTELMEGIMNYEAVPTHGSLDSFKVEFSDGTQSLGARALDRLEVDQFLGIYQGCVFSASEGLCMQAQDSPICCPFGTTGTMQLLQRARAMLHRHSYIVRLAELPQPRTVLLVSPVGVGGVFHGNVIARINDGAANPFAHHSVDGGLLGSGHEDRGANAAFVPIAHNGWVYLGVVTTQRVEKGEELLIDYNEFFWSMQAELREDVHRLQQHLTTPQWTARWFSGEFFKLRWCWRRYVEDFSAWHTARYDLKVEMEKARRSRLMRLQSV